MNKCVFENENECIALKEKRCAFCAFRKTKEELIEGRRKATERIASLPEEQKKHIIRKYNQSIRALET
jgi:hypothetical protein